MQANVGVFSLGRAQSQRCPNKMLRPFAGTTLTDLVLEKLADFLPNAFFAGEGEAFRMRCERHGVPFLQRDARSARIDGPIREILAFLERVDYEHLLLVNGCLPLLRLETIQRFLADCLEHSRQPAFGVIRRTNYFVSLEGVPLNFDPSVNTLNTKTVTPLYEFAHALYFFHRESFLRTGAYWDWKTVRLVELADGRELLDVDTEADFQLAETLWGLQQNSPTPVL